MPRHVRPRRRAPRRGRHNKVRIARKRLPGVASARQYASITETIEFQDVVANRASNAQFSLSDFYRASSLANNFKQYRAKMVTWEYAPLYNTFSESTYTTGGASKPYLYTAMNRTQGSDYVSSSFPLLVIQAQGAKPQTLTSKKVLKYRPNWVQPGPLALTRPTGFSTVSGALSVGNTPSYKWLMCPAEDTYGNKGQIGIFTDPNQSLGTPYTTVDVAAGTVIYNGHNFFLEQNNAIPLQAVAKLTCTVVWEFKEPNLSIASTGGKQDIHAPPDLPVGGDTGATGMTGETGPVE